MWGKEEERGGMPGKKKAQKERWNITREEIKPEVMIKKGYEKETFGQNTVTLFLTHYSFFMTLTGARERIQSVS